MRVTHGRDHGRREEHGLDTLVYFGEKRPARSAEQEVGNQERGDHVRQRVSDNLIRGGMVDAQPEYQEPGRCHKINHPRNSKKPEEADVEVAKALGEREPAHEQRIVQQHDLYAALCPAGVLEHIVRIGLGRQPANHRLVYIAAAVTAPVQFKRRFRVFRDAGAAHPANFFQMPPAHDCG